MSGRGWRFGPAGTDPGQGSFDLVIEVAGYLDAMAAQCALASLASSGTWAMR